MKEVIRTLVREAISKADKQGSISLPDADSASVEVSRSKDPRFGDYATNAALVLASVTKCKPRELAAAIKDNLTKDSKVLAGSEIAGPGFINFFLAPEVWHEVLNTIHREKEGYGCAVRMDGPRAFLEFVSANPTGPLHVGHGRGAAVGDTLARLLKTCGYKLETEYYVNDSGNQMKILGRSLLVRVQGITGRRDRLSRKSLSRGVPYESLHSSSLGHLSARNCWKSRKTRQWFLAAQYACDRILLGIKDDLNSFGVRYDRYFSEKVLHDSGAIAATLEELRSRGTVEEHEGALWFSMDEQQDEKDRVLVRATGEPTYFTADAAYHQDKLRRGFDLLVDIWGSDHHGYVPRVRAAIEALGYSPEVLRVLLVQFVNLVREGQKISMSTRSAEFITLREVLEEVGPDAARFFS